MGGAVSSGRDNSELIDNLVGGSYIRTRDVERVFRALDRAEYMSPDARDQAYKDLAWRDGLLHLSAPCIYSEVMEGLELKPGLSFLNVGSGTGYLSTLVGMIIGSSGINHGIEVHASVVEYANKKLSQFIENSPALDEFDFCEPKFYSGNGLCLAPLQTPYDRVYCGAGCPEEYQNYFKQLIKIGGILVMPLNDNLLQVRRVGEAEWRTRSLLNVSFATLRVPSKEEAADVIKLEEQFPAQLQRLCRAVVRSRMRAALMSRHAEVREPPPKPPQPRRNAPRRICIPVEDDQDENLNALHDLDIASGASEMNALLSLVLSMGHNRVAGALRFDSLDSSHSTSSRSSRSSRSSQRSSQSPRSHHSNASNHNSNHEANNSNSNHSESRSNAANSDGKLWFNLTGEEFPVNSQDKSNRSEDNSTRSTDNSVHADNSANLADESNQSAGNTAHSANNSVHSANNTAHSANNSVHSANNTAHSANNSAHSANNSSQSANNSALSANRSPRTLRSPSPRSPAATDEDEYNTYTGGYTSFDGVATRNRNAPTTLGDGAGEPKRRAARSVLRFYRDDSTAASDRDRTNTHGDSSTDKPSTTTTPPDEKVPAEVEVYLEDGVPEPATSAVQCDRGDSKRDHSSDEEESTDSTSRANDKRHKLDSGLGEENTPTGTASPDKTERSDDSDTVESHRSNSLSDDADDTVKGRRRLYKRGHGQMEPASWSSSTEGDDEEGDGSTRQKRRASESHRPRSEAWRVRLSVMMKRAVKELPLPYPLKKYVNLGRCFEF